MLPPYDGHDDISTMEAPSTMNIEAATTTYALWTVSCLIRLLNTRTEECPLILDHIPKNTIAIVVVLIPPAVDEGAEPMNISIEYINVVPCERSSISIVPNPALRVDIVLNINAIVLSPFVPYF